jgi:hypothetical protein
MNALRQMLSEQEETTGAEETPRPRHRKKGGGN